MNPVWQAFLQEYNATIEKGHVIHFRDDVTELKNAQTDTILVDLSNFGLIHFSGEEVLTFLQGQLTCDLRKIDHQTAQYGSYCTPKGRILANFIIWSHADHNEYFMQLPSTLLEAISKRLSMYILRAKVRLNDSSDSLIRIGIAGNKAKLLIEEIFHSIALPISPLGIIHTEQGSILCQDINRYEIITTLDHAVMIWPHLALKATPVGTFCWDWLEIKAGIPVILPITQEQFIPQMVNFDVTGGVSFQKGCYPGQEIIARTQYLGKLKRRMYLVNIASSQPVMAGDQLFSAELLEQSCGMIVNATPSPEGGFDALAVIQTNSVEAGKIFWKNLEGPALQILSLPYLLPQ
ncbi:folate-binding protein YgfZ [Nitrosomonas sp. Is37]|uniref:CAF17-like 4Fe-4S cluster assembly/insertion protein YgfZ n=1 Tax=Nitrosomonas sp. Is37 TaxID=3080535 RepID=UPI00294B895F|nr:folate-binding protein YgfZ [Nitrosomonas sp. Is37]MDV6345653.1 folate-binding protein YgfZ [Nitrosomonas sp. Is37]